MTVNVSENIKKTMGWCPNAETLNKKEYTDTASYEIKHIDKIKDIKTLVEILIPITIALGLNYILFFKLETTHWIWLSALTIMDWFSSIMAPFMVLSRPPFFLGIIALLSIIIFLECFLAYVLRD